MCSNEDFDSGTMSVRTSTTITTIEHSVFRTKPGYAMSSLCSYSMQLLLILIYYSLDLFIQLLDFIQLLFNGFINLYSDCQSVHGSYFEILVYTQFFELLVYTHFLYTDFVNLGLLY